MRPLTIATWNVNSVRAREARLTAWLRERQPDVVCLQELKCEEATFPWDPIRFAGYEACIAGQKTYNGVAILARAELSLTDVQRGLDDGEPDPHARLIAATVGGVRVVSVYAPNGQSVGSDKWNYKLAWYDRLRGFLETRCRAGEPLALCGDFNVAPEARDVHDPARWEAETLYHPRARQALADVTSWGLTDTFRQHVDDGGFYSWWDYRAGSFHKNMGLRIDHIFATAPLAQRCLAASIDREARKGKDPSDHTPVVASFEYLDA